MSPKKLRALGLVVAAVVVVVVAMLKVSDGVREEMVLPPPPAVPRDSLPMVHMDTVFCRPVPVGKECWGTTQLSEEWTHWTVDTTEGP